MNLEFAAACPLHYSWPPRRWQRESRLASDNDHVQLSCSRGRIGAPLQPEYGPTGVCVCVCPSARLNVLEQILPAQKGSKENDLPLSAHLCCVCKCIRVSTESTELRILLCISPLVWIARRDLESDLCSQPPSHPPLLSHNSTATSKAPLTFLPHNHLSVMLSAPWQHRDTRFSVNWTLAVYIGINQHSLSVIPEVTPFWSHY